MRKVYLTAVLNGHDAGSPVWVSLTQGFLAATPFSSFGLFFVWLSYGLLSASLPLSAKISRFGPPPFFSSAFSQPSKSPFSLSLLTFSLLHHTFQLSSSSLSPPHLYMPLICSPNFFCISTKYANYTLTAVWFLSLMLNYLFLWPHFLRLRSNWTKKYH